jgi:hypothetical protein
LVRERSRVQSSLAAPSFLRFFNPLLGEPFLARSVNPKDRESRTPACRENGRSKCATCDPESPSRIRLERAKGIEPSYEAWEASVLPLNYARSDLRRPKPQMAGEEGLEPPTPGFGDRCSNQIELHSYERRSCRIARPEARVDGASARLDFAASHRQFPRAAPPTLCGSPQGPDAHLPQL